MDSKGSQFESLLWPHLRGAYNFARWLARNEHDAEDIVQESFTRAFQSLDTFRGGDARVWLMAIVRNTAMTFLKRKRSSEGVPWSDAVPEPADNTPSAEQRLIQTSRREQVKAAIERLQDEFREAVILREFEGLSYKEIGGVLSVPLGTVMSRLSRGRSLLMEALATGKGVAG